MKYGIFEWRTDRKVALRCCDQNNDFDDDDEDYDGNEDEERENEKVVV